jgi:ribosomal protein RSM22 (predicted rRNA methylase)
VVRHWIDRLLAPGGTLILIEPALRETSRALLQVRDRLRAAGLHIVAPCFCQTSCPALVRERDWCHDAVSSNDGRRIDFSYLVVRRAALTEPVSTDWLRIVSDPLPEKGKLRLFACGAGGRTAVVRLDRHASPANAALDRLGRGDVARIAFAPAPAPESTPAPHPGETRIGRDTRVERVDWHRERRERETPSVLDRDPRALPDT